MEILLPLFQLFYFIVHFLYSLAQSLFDCFWELYYAIGHAFLHKKMYQRSNYDVMADCLHLKKLPFHLAFICMPNQIHNFGKICLAMEWGAKCGIKYFSIYDSKGILKEDFKSTLSTLHESLKDVHLKVYTDGNEYLLSQVNSSKNDSIATAITINLLAPSDGQNNLCDVAKVFSMSNASVNFDNISKLLSTQGQPDPDLAIIVGNPLTPCGFLPWQIRLTEFISLSSASKLDYIQFHQILQKFSKCDQRLGR